MTLDSGSSAAPMGRADEVLSDARLIVASLEALSGRESQMLEHFYDLFFERHPEVRPLFGEHGLNEREEMLRETLVSVLAHAEDEPWLDENLKAMGRSHAEYGVEGHSYPDFVAAMLDTLDHVAAPGWCVATRAAWGRALGRVSETMRRSGEAALGSE